MSKERARLDMAHKADEMIIIALRKQVKELQRAELARCAEESEKQSEYEGGLLDRIAELKELIELTGSQYNAARTAFMNQEVMFKKRNAELEKTWSVEYMPIDDRQLVYLTADDLKRIKLEQEAKGVERVLCENSLSLVKRERMVLKRIMKQLHEKANALKEQE